MHIWCIRLCSFTHCKHFSNLLNYLIVSVLCIIYWLYTNAIFFFANPKKSMFHNSMLEILDAKTAMRFIQFFTDRKKNWGVISRTQTLSTFRWPTIRNSKFKYYYRRQVNTTCRVLNRRVARTAKRTGAYTKTQKTNEKTTPTKL